jgi:cytochrome c553
VTHPRSGLRAPPPRGRDTRGPARPVPRCSLSRALVGLASALITIGAAAQAPLSPEVCAGCHGKDGNPTLPGIPVLAGQTARYVYLQLRDFAEGRRTNDQMAPLAKAMSRDDMHALADFYAAQKPLPQDFKVDAEKARLGKLKADETLCTMCHLGGFAGQNEIPRVAGQRFDYVVKQLADFKARRRTNDAGNMTSVARTLSDTDIDNLAHYLAGL